MHWHDYHFGFAVYQGWHQSHFNPVNAQCESKNECHLFSERTYTPCHSVCRLPHCRGPPSFWSMTLVYCISSSSTGGALRVESGITPSFKSQLGQEDIEGQAAWSGVGWARSLERRLWSESPGPKLSGGPAVLGFGKVCSWELRFERVWEYRTCLHKVCVFAEVRAPGMWVMCC